MHSSRLSDSVLLFTGDCGEEHLTAIATGDGLVVVDTLATPADTLAALPLVREFSDEPVRVVINTHLDVDHVAGNHVFAGAAILAHAYGSRHVAEPLFDGPAAREMTRGFLQRLQASEAPSDPALAARRQGYIHMYAHLLEHSGEPSVAAPPFLFVPGGTRVVLGRLTLELYHYGPGHTDADLVIFVPAEDLLLTGDVVMGRGYAPLMQTRRGGSPMGLARALEEIHRLAADTTRIVPGHGAVGDRTMVREARAYVETLLHDVGEAQARGLTLEAARPALESAAFASHFFYDLAHAGNVDLAWQEMSIWAER